MIKVNGEKGEVVLKGESRQLVAEILTVTRAVLENVRSSNEEFADFLKKRIIEEIQSDFTAHECCSHKADEEEDEDEEDPIETLVGILTELNDRLEKQAGKIKDACK